MPCASPPLRALAETLHAVPCRTGPHVHAASKSGQVWVRGLELVDSLRSVLLDPCVRDAMCVAAIAGIGGNAPRGSLPDWTPRPCCVKKRTGLGSRPGPPPPEGGGAKMPTRRTGSGSKPFTQKIGEVLGNCQNCKVLCQEIWITITITITSRGDALSPYGLRVACHRFSFAHPRSNQLAWTPQPPVGLI
jgi:hypothetical protein